MYDLDPVLAECSRKAKNIQRDDAILRGVSLDGRESVARYVVASEAVDEFDEVTRLAILGQCLSNPVIIERVASSLRREKKNIRGFTAVALWHTLCFRDQINPFSSRQ